jgi:hypothetical protein
MAALQPWPPALSVVTDYIVGHGGSVTDPDTLQQCIDAAESFLPEARPDLVPLLSTGEAQPHHILGACRFAANLYARRGTTGGQATYGEAGVPTVYAVDDTVSRLWSLWSHRRPSVGGASPVVG